MTYPHLSPLTPPLPVFRVLCHPSRVRVVGEGRGEALRGREAFKQEVSGSRKMKDSSFPERYANCEALWAYSAGRSVLWDLITIYLRL